MQQAAAGKAAARELGYTHMKSEQLRVVEAFIQGRDVFAILPTGYGKSLCYGCFHLHLTTCSKQKVHSCDVMRAIIHSCKLRTSLTPDPRTCACGFARFGQGSFASEIVSHIHGDTHD